MGGVAHHVHLAKSDDTIGIQLTAGLPGSGAECILTTETGTMEIPAGSEVGCSSLVVRCPAS